jgi:hypothetical protein
VLNTSSAPIPPKEPVASTTDTPPSISTTAVEPTPALAGVSSEEPALPPIASGVGVESGAPTPPPVPVSGDGDGELPERMKSINIASTSLPDEPTDGDGTMTIIHSPPLSSNIYTGDVPMTSHPGTVCGEKPDTEMVDADSSPLDVIPDSNVQIRMTRERRRQELPATGDSEEDKTSQQERSCSPRSAEDDGEQPQQLASPIDLTGDEGSMGTPANDDDHSNFTDSQHDNRPDGGDKILAPDTPPLAGIIPPSQSRAQLTASSLPAAPMTRQQTRGRQAIHKSTADDYDEVEY